MCTCLIYYLIHDFLRTFACSGANPSFFSSKPKPKRTRRTRARLGGAVCVPVSKTSERDHALHMLCSLDGAAHPTSADNRHWTAALTSPIDPVMRTSSIRGRCFVPALSFCLRNAESARVLRGEAIRLLTDDRATDLNRLLRDVGYVLVRRRPQDATTPTTAKYDRFGLRDLFAAYGGDVSLRPCIYLYLCLCIHLYGWSPPGTHSPDSIRQLQTASNPRRRHVLASRHLHRNFSAPLGRPRYTSPCSVRGRRLASFL